MLRSMAEQNRVELQVFITSGCDQCERALGLAREMEGSFPRLAVRVVDIENTPNTREDVFAVPTFVLDDQVLSLGNPQRTQLRHKVQSLLRERGLVD